MELLIQQKIYLLERRITTAITTLEQCLKLQQMDFTFFIGPRSHHSLPMSVTNWLTHSLTDDLVEYWINWPKYADFADYVDYADFAEYA